MWSVSVRGRSYLHACQEFHGEGGVESQEDVIKGGRSERRQGEGRGLV